MKWLQRGRKIHARRRRLDSPELTARPAEYLHFFHTIKKARAERLLRGKQRIDLAADGGTVIDVGPIEHQARIESEAEDPISCGRGGRSISASRTRLTGQNRTYPVLF